MLHVNDLQALRNALVDLQFYASKINAAIVFDYDISDKNVQKTLLAILEECEEVKSLIFNKRGNND